MANLRDLFAAYYSPGEDAVATALRTGLVTPDTNVLLAAYRFERQARDELLSAFEQLGDRLWVPYQVALEFHRNRLGVIADQEAFFGRARKDLGSAMAAYLGKVKAFTGRIAMPLSRAQELEQMIGAAHEQVMGQVDSAEEANEVHLDRRNSDEVLTRLESLLDGRVGEPMDPSALEAARKEGKRRVDHKIPPGYADKDKADPTGDYLVWRQLMDQAGIRRVPVVLVTDDRKEDWVRREHGLTLGPRPELSEEMLAASGAPFFLMSTETFLRHAREYLSVSVSPETVDQARDLGFATEDQFEPWLSPLDKLAIKLSDTRDMRRRAEDAVAATAHEEESLRMLEEEAAEDGIPLAESQRFAQRLHRARSARAEAQQAALELKAQERSAEEAYDRKVVEMRGLLGVQPDSELQLASGGPVC